MKQMDRLANKLKRTVDITVRVNEVVTRATGGVTNTPVAAPITNRVSAQSAGDTTINITGGISTSAEIGESVVNAIRAYNRAAGPANIAVS
jgi:succinyl-CoA synthetase beta subunit